jgi:hypothetical protein
MRENSNSQIDLNVQVWVIALTLALMAGTIGCRSKHTDVNDTEQTSTAADVKGRGAGIIAEYEKREQAPYRKSRLRLTVNSETEPVKSYELEVSRKQNKDETLTLMHVTKPADDRDLASLTSQRPDQKTTSVTYAQSTDRFYEAGANKQFFGGLTTQELLSDWSKYEFRFISEKEVDGVPAFELEGTRGPKADSTAISRMVVLLRKDTYLPVWLHLFDSGGDEIRTFHITDYKSVAGKDVVWRTEVINLLRKSKILIEMLDVSFPDTIDEKTFDRDNLKQLVSR